MSITICNTNNVSDLETI